MYSEDHRLEKQREAQRRHRERNAERVKARAAELYQQKKAADPNFLDKQREKTRQWRAKNREASIDISRRADLKRYHGTKDEAFELLGNKCIKCCWTDRRALQIDHIEAIGDAKRRELNQRGRVLYREVKANPSKFQLLCANCNWIKRAENNELKSKSSEPRNTSPALLTEGQRT